MDGAAVRTHRLRYFYRVQLLATHNDILVQSKFHIKLLNYFRLVLSTNDKSLIDQWLIIPDIIGKIFAHFIDLFPNSPLCFGR